MSIDLHLENLGMAGITNACTPDSTGSLFISEQGANTTILLFTSLSADVTSYPVNFGDYFQGTFTADYDDLGTGGSGTLTGAFSILND